MPVTKLPMHQSRNRLAQILLSTSLPPVTQRPLLHKSIFLQGQVYTVRGNGGIRDEDKAKLRFIQSLPLKEQVIELHKLFYDRMEVAAYFRDKCVKKEEEMDALVSEFDIRIRRHFWQNLIYNEHSQSGKLLKQSMQQ